LGYSGAGVSARDWSWISSLLHPEDLDRLLPLFDVWDTAQDGQIFETSYRLQHADGSWRWFVSRDTPFQRNAAGRITQIVGTIEDITVRLRALEQLQESEHKFRQLADAIPHIVWICRVDGAMTHINARATEYTGLHVHDLIGWKWGNALHPADREETLRRWTDILQSGVPSDLEFRLRAADGGYRWHVGRQVPIRNEQRGITQWFGTCTDIEDQKRAHAMLAGLNRVLAQIAAGASLTNILDDLVLFVEEMLGDSRGSILLLDADGRHLRLGAAPNLPPAYNRAIDGVEIGPNVGSCGTAAYLRETVVVGDIAADERWQAFRELAAEHGLVSCWSVPILAREAEANSEVLGTFAVYPGGIGVPGPAEFAVIRRAADLARVAIERDRTIRAMRESEAKFRTLAECFPDTILVVDPESRDVPLKLLYVNPAIQQSHGYQPEQVIGQSLPEFLHTPAAAAQAPGRVSRLLAGEVLTFEVAHRHQSGREIPMEVRAGLVPWEGRQVILGIGRDLTSWKQAQEHLKLLEVSIARINDVVMITNANYEIIYVNDAFERLTGHRRADVLNRRPSFLHGPRTDRKELTRIDQALQRNEPVRAELYNYKQDGTEFILEMDIVAILDHDGRATHYAAVERDITERRRAEAELRESEERLRVALAAASSVAFVWNAATNRFTRYFSNEPSMPSNLGSPETLQEVAARVHPDDRTAFSERLRASLETGATYRNSFRILRSDGSIRWLESYGTISRNEAGQPLRLTGISIDVTERKRADEERDRLWNEALDPVCIAGFDGRFKQVNPAWERLLGWPKETLTERAWMDFVHPDDHAATEQALERLRNGQSLTGFENRYRCRDGSYRNFLWNASTLPEWRTIFGIVRDVTEHKQLEAQLRQSQKMEAIGQLAGGIAHDFNNIITVISGYGSLLQTQIPPEHAAQLGVREVLKAAQSATDLVKKLLAFSRKQSWQLTVIDLHELLVNAESWVRRLLGDGIVLQSRLHARAASVLADRGQLEQVLLNLALNARDAMNGQGELSVETADDTLVLAGDDSDHREVPAVRLTVRDTGAGIDPAILPKIFDPFVTTKPVGQGTGLGLSTVYGFVRQCRGTVTAESEPGCGAAFIIRLPTVDGRPDPAAAATSPRPAEAAARPSGTILLV
ncbi:MAG: PAS domain S-box protein, partial [Planctomycetaceae bacterium]|nr:PAS domain S-box protein [Planctomycetaceae bacterium]